MIATIEEAGDAIREFILVRGYDGGRYQSDWLDIIDQTLADLRAELATGPVMCGNPPKFQEEQND